MKLVEAQSHDLIQVITCCAVTYAIEETIENWCQVIKSEKDNYKIWDKTGGTGRIARGDRFITRQIVVKTSHIGRTNSIRYLMFLKDRFQVVAILNHSVGIGWRRLTTIPGGGLEWTIYRRIAARSSYGFEKVESLANCWGHGRPSISDIHNSLLGRAPGRGG